MVLYAYMCCVFLIRRESPDMILVDKPHISEVVLSQELNLGMKRLKDENECRTPMLISADDGCQPCVRERMRVWGGRRDAVTLLTVSRCHVNRFGMTS
jgi:hypothetical protein